MTATNGNNWTLGETHHLGLTVSDIERSIVFYRDTLGMTLIRRRPSVDNDYVGLQTGYPGVVLNVASFRVNEESAVGIELVQYMNHTGEAALPATNQPGISHLCLTVDNLRACHADLTAKGVRFRSDPVTITAGPNTGGLVVYFFDPDGYALELFSLFGRNQRLRLVAFQMVVTINSGKALSAGLFSRLSILSLDSGVCHERL